MATVCVFEIVVKCHSQVYETFLAHITNVAKTLSERPGFQRAMITQLEDDSNGWKQLMVEYNISDKNQLQQFFENDAAKIGDEEKQKFGDKSSVVHIITRDVLYQSSK